MPHITIEYTNTVAGTIDIEGLVASLHEAAATTGTFPIGGIRTSRVRPIPRGLAIARPGTGLSRSRSYRSRPIRR